MTFEPEPAMTVSRETQSDARLAPPKPWWPVVVMALACVALVAPWLFRSPRGEHVHGVPIERLQLKKLEMALERYRIDIGRYPGESEGGLTALPRPPGEVEAGRVWRGPYAKDGDLHDQWQRPFEYRCPGIHNPERFDLVCAGQDGEFGTADDVKNWAGP